MRVDGILIVLKGGRERERGGGWLVFRGRGVWKGS